MIPSIEPCPRPGVPAQRVRGAALLLALMGSMAAAGGGTEVAGTRAAISALYPVSPQPSPPVG